MTADDFLEVHEVPDGFWGPGLAVWFKADPAAERVPLGLAKVGEMAPHLDRWRAHLTAVIAAAKAEEREACAAVADNHLADGAAGEIRARGD